MMMTVSKQDLCIVFGCEVQKVHVLFDALQFAFCVLSKLSLTIKTSYWMTYVNKNEENFRVNDNNNIEHPHLSSQASP